MQYLVQQAELEQKAKDLGVTVTDEGRRRSSSTQIKKQYFGGKETKLPEAAEGAGRSPSRSCRLDLARAAPLGDALQRRSPASVKVTDAEITKYYNDAQGAVRAAARAATCGTSS